MNDVYTCKKLRKYSIQVQSVAVYDNYLVVGNCLGNILWYKTSPKVSLLYYDKRFHGKPIMQLAAIPQLRVIVCLSGKRGVSVLKVVESQHESIHCNSVDVVNAKGASCFAVDVKTRVGAEHSVSDGLEIRLCIANEKQLQIYRWDGNSFSQQYPIVGIRLDVPRMLLWCNHFIIIGCINEYYLVDVNTNQLNPFVLTGKCLEPIIVKMSDTAFGVVKDSQLIVMSTTKNTDEEQIIRLDDTPSFVLYDAPYLLVSIGNALYVRTIKTFDGHPVVRQVIATDSKITKMFGDKSGLIYATSATDVWRLAAVPFAKQIKRLFEEKHFPLAFTLAKISDESIDEKDINETRIRKLYAEDLFKNKKYRESMKEFLKLNIDPYKVIKIFPDLLPQNNSDDIKEIDDEDKKMRVVALIDYLVEVRRKFVSRIVDVQKQPSVCEEINSYQEQLLQIIDTTLLKCYLQTNDAMIAPLVRLNKCHFLESETALRKYKKYNELVILYQVKGLHRKALEFLKEHSDDTESSVNGPSKTIQYLQNIGAEHVDLILEFSDWVLRKYPDEGLGVFTADVGDVARLPRSRILGHLKENHGRLVVPYLERVIHVWNDTDTAFHDDLICRYAELVREHSSSEPAAEADERIARDAREKLLSFLKWSDHYSLEKMLLHFPIHDGCFEERVIVLEKLGRHEQVLSIYVYRLNDVGRACEYCDRVYASGNENSDQIYVTLLKLLNDPTDDCMVELSGAHEISPDLENTIKILNEYASSLPFSNVFEHLSDDIPIHRIERFLVVALETAVSGKRRNQLNRGILFARSLQMQQQKILYESQRVNITKDHKCCQCENLFGPNNAFVRYPDGKIAHLSCHKDL